ncbi:YjeF family domain-containing protein [Cladophialophora bantiana CBS 173.52]|uniref:NAD(P)H-hydrate epimerase n=1 Tax=Cladophialophora bantiana (strain ATCC 10958 / CBS 173.52 / CDC B-1940 / NIH 8579) TaxID=1442370 RepID=A0A0D2HYM4_CLAB1|nr:YjeF family domain-containing protein [Cladophialophora bantiana CBS 173.52]KIW89719.1 YjeF family domain-containing protein [Cladophialophora bantiana CBS 173.52]
MALKTLAPQKAADLDKELMSEEGGFSIDQLMELAGLSVSQAVYKVHPPSQGKNILIACGPGNNGGDGLVCARHLHHYGYNPEIYYPKPTNAPIFTGLQKQLRHLHIPFLTTTEEYQSSLGKADLIIDSLFGFSFKPPVRAPFDTVLKAMIESKKPVLSVDIPSSWDVAGGPPEEGQLGHDFMPDYLISLTAAKPCVKFFKGKKHFMGGRFLSKDVAAKYGLDVPDYQGIDQVAEVDVGAPVEKL